VSLSYDNPDRALFDAETITDLTALTVRRCVAGDTFHPYGMKGCKRVARYLIDRKVPRLLREEIPVLSDRQNIFWVVGQRIAHPYRVTEATRRVVEVVFTGHAGHVGRTMTNENNTKVDNP